MRRVTPNDVPADAQIIDVREDDEWATVHAEGAVHIPMGDVPGRLSEIDTDRDVYVICHLGGRSAKVAEYLESQGIEAINIEGGTDAWVAANLPVVRS